VFTPGVDAEIEDISERRQFDFANQERRIELDARERARKERDRGQKREEDRQGRLQELRIDQDRWEVEKRERLTALTNRSWMERATLGMAVVGFLVAIAFCIVGLLSGQKYVGGSGGSVALALLGVAFHQVRQEQKQGIGAMKPPGP
jgi:cytochrome c-type biogenesis protein CcmH/NrfG